DQRHRDAQDEDDRPHELMDKLINHDAYALLKLMAAPYGGSVAVRSWAASIHAVPSGTARSITSGNTTPSISPSPFSGRPSRFASSALRRTAGARFNGCAFSAVARRSTASPR